MKKKNSLKKIQKKQEKYKSNNNQKISDLKMKLNIKRILKKVKVWISNIKMGKRNWTKNLKKVRKKIKKCLWLRKSFS